MQQYAELSILNVYDGDTRLTFDPSKPVARERAKRIITEMLRRGYAIVVRGGGVGDDAWYARVDTFDPQTCEYLIEGLSKDEEQEIAEQLAGVKPKRGKKRLQRLSAETTPAVAVSRAARGCAREIW